MPSYTKSMADRVRERRNRQRIVTTPQKPDGISVNGSSPHSTVATTPSSSNNGSPGSNNHYHWSSVGGSVTRSNNSPPPSPPRQSPPRGTPNRSSWNSTASSYRPPLMSSAVSLSASPSWEDEDCERLLNRGDRSGSPDSTNTPARRRGMVRRDSGGASVSSDTKLLAVRRNLRDEALLGGDTCGDDDDDDIPMDERSADLRSVGRTSPQYLKSSPNRRHLPPTVELQTHEQRQAAHNNNASTHATAPYHSHLQQYLHVGSNTTNTTNTTTTTNTTAPSSSGGVEGDDVSSLGGIEDELGLPAILTALRNGSTKMPVHLTTDERILWDVVQGVIAQARATTEDWEVKHQQLQERLDMQQEEQDRALRAIQRVLADVTEERDQALAKQEVSRALDKENVANANEQDHDAALASKSEMDVMRTELESKSARIIALERQLKLMKALQSRRDDQAETDTSAAENNARKQEIQDLQEKVESLTASLESKDKQIAVLTSTSDSGTSSEVALPNDVEALKAQLTEKTSALESAKMIIASLENASGSAANDNRAKLKAKEGQVTHMRGENARLQKKLDTLAMELREAQRARAKSEARNSQDRARSAALLGVLEQNMADLRSAAVILETTNDANSVDNLGDLLAESMDALKRSVEVMEESDGTCATDMDSTASATSSRSSRASPDAIYKDLRRELEDKTLALKRLEDEMRKQREEALHFKNELEKSSQKREKEVQSLYGEIRKLRTECNTNLEVLTKKERELAVLRDSLKVEDDVGYISDDASEAEDEDEHASVVTSTYGGQYGPSQAEALATLLAHSRASGAATPQGAGGASAPVDADSEALKAELTQAVMEKEKAVKELKTEKESLASAKMIISSLEKANKSMMEDLRSRLHDSNTAIASLLEKSMQSEKTTAKLQAELEVLRKEKVKNEVKLHQQGPGLPMAILASDLKKKAEAAEADL